MSKKEPAAVKSTRITVTGTIIVAIIGLISALVLGYWQFVLKQGGSDHEIETEYVGRVIDVNAQQTIAGAKITLDLEGVPQVVYTDSEGVYQFKVTMNSDISGQIRVEAQGYQIYTRNIFLSSTIRNIEDIRLVPAALSHSSAVIEVDWRENFYNFFQYEYPCVDEFGASNWSKELIALFDISNVGGQNIELIKLPSLEEIITSVDGIHVEVTFSAFAFVEDFDNWMREHGLDPEKYSWRDEVKLVTPFTLNAGSARRIVLLERITMKAEAKISPQKLSVAVREYDWITYPTFVLADGTTVQDKILLWAPYIGTPYEGSNTPSFEACKKP